MLMIGIVSCRSAITPSIPAISADMEEHVKKAASRSLDRDSLRSRRVGKSGYYYVVDADGRVVMHPSAMLEGRNFGSLWFMQQVLARRQGCLRYRLGDRTYAIFFVPLGEREILCLSVLADELRSGFLDCPLAEAPAPDGADNQND